MNASTPVVADLHGELGHEVRLPKTRMLIGGTWQEAADGRRIDVEDPATGQVFASVPAGTAADVERAVRQARAAFESAAWARMRPLDRGRIIEAVARKIEDHAQELALLESYDNGKAVHHALAVDVPAAVDIFRYMAGWTSKLYGQVNPISGDGRHYHSYSVREPIGVVGQIVPWNYPLAMAAWKIASALAAGCTIILKPSEVTPLTALRLAELALEAGLPEGVLNIVTGYGHEAGQALVEHPGIDKIAFTGSTRVGKQIVQTAAKDLKRVTLELGGKSPSLIFADADLEQAALGAALAIFFNSGQVCLAASRLYVERSVFDKVVDGVAQAAKGFKLGHGRDPDTMLGPLVSRVQQRRVLDYIEQGKASGAELVAGGGIGEQGGYFVEPTIFANPSPDATIVREEIFGPVLVATPFDDVDEVVKRANDTRYGLAANIWTRDLSRAHLIARRLQAGTVWINTHGMNDPSAPFGGVKESGWGREVGEEGLLHYMETKTVTALLSD
ncbi:aldehyde dehydrogenase family protein [Sphingobium sp.]|uniref:aldehyde dehydrogenase family protein n=1 Tax=Sphingobium sp. TaxID=1912891 RepID=UPI002C9AC15A|nr:aldehyde dehydrogenase family protein [Sphingobium sp.]HUD93471.1 aldehyde dehydrogenase family protein [Sphingobium sp.]